MTTTPVTATFDVSSMFLEPPHTLVEWVVQGTVQWSAGGVEAPFRHVWSSADWDDPEAEARDFIRRLEAEGADIVDRTLGCKVSQIGPLVLRR